MHFDASIVRHILALSKLMKDSSLFQIGKMLKDFQNYQRDPVTALKHHQALPACLHSLPNKILIVLQEKALPVQLEKSPSVLITVWFIK